MPTFQIFKETAVPGTLTANAIYFVTSPDTNHVELYVTNSLGTAVRYTPRKEDIQAMIDSSLSNMDKVEIVANIAARNALTHTHNMKVWVVDATGDATVDSGGAEYLWDHANTQYIKTSEFESMDVTVGWSDIVGRPTSSVAAIDSAVANAHTHANSTQLAKVGESGGFPTYDGISLVQARTISW